ncbi:MAG: CpaF family protein [Zoogloea sp.]|nr:MAG: CpaF family protein [Zoogloea sp.]
MSIRARFGNGDGESLRPEGSDALSPGARRNYQEIKKRIHQTLLDRVDLARLQKLGSEQIGDELKILIEQLMIEEDVALNEQDRRNLTRDIRWEMLGLGPLEPLLADPSISDILVNTHKQVYVERRGRLELTDISFQDEQHLMKIIDKIVSRVGRRVDESSPMVDARLPDGSRVNAIIPPLAIDGPIMSIRRFSVTPLRLDDLLGFKALTEPMARTLEALSRAKVNLIISGGTGSGKTTLLNIMSAGIPASERIITIEDAAELQMQQPHVVRLETRPPNIEGKGEVTQRVLVRNALRMRPDRIILGEVRGAEAFDMLQAMNTGHEGSMATIHANTPRDALSRLENMIGMASMTLTPKAIRQQIASAISVIVQTARLVDGKRKIISIQELTGMEGETISMQEVFGFRQTGLLQDGTVEGYFAASGVRPVFHERLRTFGIRLPDEFFDPNRRFS